jgi:hypothetical protein
MVLEAADEYLAAEARTPATDRRHELKRETKKRIAEIFAEAAPPEARGR